MSLTYSLVNELTSKQAYEEITSYVQFLLLDR